MKRKDRSKRLVIPLKPYVRLEYAVYGRPGTGAPRTLEEMRPLQDAWLRLRADEEVIRGVEHIHRLKALVVGVHERNANFEWPPGELEVAETGELEQSRLDVADTVATIIAVGPLLRPRADIWAAHSMACALAEAWEGAVIDLTIHRLLPQRQLRFPIPPQGKIHLARHLMGRFEGSEEGLSCVRTIGMSKFGLPNLALPRNPVPRSVMAYFFLRGVAQRLVDAMMPQASDAYARRKDPTEITLPDETDILRFDPMRAFTMAVSPSPRGKEVLAGVRIHHQRDIEGWPDGILWVGPRRAYKGTVDDWLAEILDRLLEPGPPVPEVMPQGMREARQRAQRELPGIQVRFLEGLPPGTRLEILNFFAYGEKIGEELWMEVKGWDGDWIHAVLLEAPRLRSDVRKGWPLGFHQSCVRDWRIVHPDGREEGHHTASDPLHWPDECDAGEPPRPGGTPNA